MITLDPQLENQLVLISSEKGVSISELIKIFIINYQLEHEAIKRADESYADYKKTGETTSLKQILKNNSDK